MQRVAIARKTMCHACRNLVDHRLQYVTEVLVRISLVQEDGKTALHRKLELALKRVPLCIPWR